MLTKLLCRPLSCMVLSPGSLIVAICASVTKFEGLDMAKVTSIEAMLLKTQLHWGGHVFRMEDYRLPMIVLHGQLSTGHRDNGAPRKKGTKPL